LGKTKGLIAIESELISRSRRARNARQQRRERNETSGVGDEGELKLGMVVLRRFEDRLEVQQCKFLLSSVPSDPLPLVRARGEGAYPSSTLTSWNSIRVTMGASMLWVEGDMSSSFLRVRIQETQGTERWQAKRDEKSNGKYPGYQAL
jgi:hypothetical protein